MISMGVVNNLALHPKFVPQFEEKLCTDFIPGVLKMMDLLSLSLPHDTITKTFLPVMASSISTIANFFADANLRKRVAGGEADALWNSSCRLLTRYSSFAAQNSASQPKNASGKGDSAPKNASGKKDSKPQSASDKSVTKVILATLSMLVNFTTTPLTKPFTSKFAEEWCAVCAVLLQSDNATTVIIIIIILFRKSNEIYRTLSPRGLETVL